ncbi:hypothetical protein ACHMW7_11115 [Aminobacter sp. UC22_36]|uniref:hypothetical protein n=1 Tax=Aminobacter sp. UC22_36 TaxID=3374549 RepID=UPI003757FC2A
MTQAIEGCCASGNLEGRCCSVACEASNPSVDTSMPQPDSMAAQANIVTAAARRFLLTFNSTLA